MMITWFLPGMFTLSSVGGFLLFRGPFEELTRGWYAVVGQAVFLAVTK